MRHHNIRRHSMQCIQTPHMVAAIKMRGSAKLKRMAVRIKKDAETFRLTREAAGPRRTKPINPLLLSRPGFTQSLNGMSTTARTKRLYPECWCDKKAIVVVKIQPSFELSPEQAIHTSSISISTKGTRWMATECRSSLRCTIARTTTKPSGVASR